MIFRGSADLKNQQRNIKMNKIDITYNFIKDYSTEEALKTLRTNILFSCSDVKAITVTSCESNDGKSTISVELAHSLTQIGKKVLLVDADMRKSVILSQFTKGVSVKGLSHYLSGQATLDEVFLETQIPGFYVIFSGEYPPNPAELLSADIFSNMISEFKESFDYIIIDTPPLGIVTDAAICARASDGSIIVLNCEKTSMKAAKSVKSQLEDTGTKILGCVLNNAKKSTMYYYKRKAYKAY